jgi:peptide/nickel transport system substrate-binding protein
VCELGESTSEPPALFDSDYKTRFVDAGDKKGGTVIFADWQEANLFNPYYYNQVTEANVAVATQGGLITSTDDFKYAPDQAVDIPTTDNGGVKIPGDNGDCVTITWKLRPGLLWSDGTPLTCNDYKWTLGWIIDPTNTGLPGGKSGYLTDAGLAHYNETSTVDPADINLTVDCPSDVDMVWHLKEPYEGYLSLIPVPLQEAYNSQFSIADMITGKGWTADEVVNAPVSGPFKFSQVVPGQELNLVRNENYKDTITGGPAFLDGVTFKWYGDAGAMIAAYQGNNPEYDVATDLNDADLPNLEGLNKVLALTSLTYEFLRPNWWDQRCSLILQPARGGWCPMSDPVIRHALKLALDKDAINARLLGGNAALGATNVSPNAWFYVAPSEEPKQDLATADAELTAANYHLDANGQRFKNDNGNFTCDGDSAGTVQTGDPATVCASFDPPGAFTGVLDEGEQIVRIEACTTTRQVRQDTLAMVAGFLNALGIRTTISPVSPADIFATYNESTDSTPCALSRYNYDFAEHAFSVPLDPLSNYPVYHSTQFEPNGANDGHIADPDLDAALAAVKNTVNFSVVKDAMATVQKIYVEKTIEVPLYFRKEVYLVNPKLENFTGNPTSTGPLWNAAHWFLKGGG